jgi:hypothetical protein
MSIPFSRPAHALSVDRCQIEPKSLISLRTVLEQPERGKPQGRRQAVTDGLAAEL